MSQEDFYFKKKEPLKSCFLALRDIILYHNPEISETITARFTLFPFWKKDSLLFMAS